MRNFFWILSVLFLCGCQAAGFHLANLGDDPDVYDVQRDVQYGQNAWQKLNIFWPKNAARDSEIVVFLYGGSWRSGDKEDYTFVARQWIQDQKIVIIPDYVQYPEGRYPAFIDDIAQMTRWLDDNVDRISGDRERVHLMGHSAGAYIGAKLLSDESYLKKVGLAPAFYRSFVGIAGPYDFEPTTDRYRAIFDLGDHIKEMQVSNTIDGDEPPMFLITGGRDLLVNDAYTEKLAQKILSKGGQVKVKNYDHLGHLTLVGALSPNFALAPDMIDDIRGFWAIR